MRKIIFLFLFAVNSFQAQTTDIDGDGILDKDDECPNVPGLLEYKGCPKPHVISCALVEDEKLAMFDGSTFDYQNIETVYNKINKKILDDAVNKRAKTDSQSKEKAYIFIKYITGDSYSEQRASSYKIPIDYNFLILKFWNKNALQYAHKKYNREMLLSTNISYEDFGDFRPIMGEESFNYIKKYYNPTYNRINIPAIPKKPLGELIRIRVEFSTPYLIKVNNGLNTTTYEYKNNEWKSVTV